MPPVPATLTPSPHPHLTHTHLEALGVDAEQRALGAAVRAVEHRHRAPRLRHHRLQLGLVHLGEGGGWWGEGMGAVGEQGSVKRPERTMLDADDGGDNMPSQLLPHRFAKAAATQPPPPPRLTCTTSPVPIISISPRYRSITRSTTPFCL